MPVSTANWAEEGDGGPSPVGGSVSADLSGIPSPEVGCEEG